MAGIGGCGEECACIWKGGVEIYRLVWADFVVLRNPQRNPDSAKTLYSNHIVSKLFILCRYPNLHAITPAACQSCRGVTWCSISHTSQSSHPLAHVAPPPNSSRTSHAHHPQPACYSVCTPGVLGQAAMDKEHFGIAECHE